MTEIRFVESKDHTRVAFDVSGGGPAIVFLHGGFIQDRRCWHEAGYVERLNKHCTVITVDLRGHGESDQPDTPEGYAPDRIIEDIQAVVDACNVGRFYLWGYSLGGTMGLQIASRMTETIGAILVGVWFGKLFPQEMVAGVLSRIEKVKKARAEGTLDRMELSAPERDFFSRVDLSLFKNYSLALADYPPVEPAGLLCPTLMISGTANHLAVSKLKEREGDMRAAGVAYRFLEGLDHARELSEIDIVLPECRAFLNSLQSPSQGRNRVRKEYLEEE